jgi:hypothetical protein
MKPFFKFLFAGLAVLSSAAGQSVPVPPLFSEFRNHTGGDSALFDQPAVERTMTDAQRVEAMERLTEELTVLKEELLQAIAKTKNAPPLVPPSPLKVGMLAQFQGLALQEQLSAVQQAAPGSAVHWQRQLMVRRLRFIVGGNVAPATSIFFESDATNIGKLSPNGAKSSAVSMYVQDAQIQHTFAPELSAIVGLQLVGISRGGLESASSLMGLNYGAYQFIASSPLDNSVGRDIGVNLRGFLFEERLEYRAGLFGGRNTNLYSPLRVTARFNYDFFDKEKGFFYAGTLLGNGQILALGGGFDLQGTYRAYSADLFYDAPMGPSGSVTFLAGVTRLDGGGSDRDSTVFTGLVPRQNILLLEAGYFFKAFDLQPYVRYERQDVRATVLKQVAGTEQTLAYQNSLRSGSRYGIGLNYFIKAHSANVKVLAERVERYRASLVPNTSEPVSTGEVSLQFQYFYY